MLSCVGIVAWAENVLYVYTPDPGNIESQGSAYRTKNYAFADKISTSMSVAIWVKDVLQPIHSEEKFIAGVAGCWRLSMLSGVLGFRTGSGSAQANGYVVNDGNWHFLVGTFNYDADNAANSFQRLYVDGQLVGELETAISALATPTKAFSICAPASDMSDAWAKRNFFGYFAELSVWNRALSDSEISTLYTRRVGGNESGLVAYWPLTGTPGMATAGYKFPNAAATTGVPNLSNYYLDHDIKLALDIVDDDGFTKPYVRYVASPDWCEANNAYVQAADATGRSWSDPLTNLVETAAGAKKFERILCSPGTHKIESSISPLVEYFYLGSQDPATGEPCPKTAIIDAQGLCRHFISSSSATGESGFTVENLTFVNGSADNGGSMHFRSKIGKINNCIFHDNAATANGGAYYAYMASGTIVSNCQFYGNSAKISGGAVATDQNNTFASSYQRFVDCIFTNNTSGSDNTAGNGGGLYSRFKIELENCLFSDNKILATTGDQYGGHAYVGVNSILNGCVFTGSCKATYGTCLWIPTNPVTVTNCVFKNMTCSGASYSFIHLQNDGAGSKFVDCVFTNNANVTSLFYQNSKNLLVRQCLIADNASGQAVVPNLAGSTVFENCTIPQANVTPATVDKATTNTFINCIMPNATITSSGNYCNILSNCLVKVAQGGPFDSGVITGNPKFTDAANGDYTLEANSQCRDKALTLDWMTAGSTDLLGNPRVVDTSGVAFTPAALPDLGCYEIQERKPSGLMLFVR